MADSRSTLCSEDSSLLVLLEQCKAQIKAYQKGTLNGDSTCCTEIIRRAAEDANNEALSVLLDTISKPIIEQECRKEYPEMLEDWEDIAQEVNLRLIRKFYNQTEPFIVTTFAAYHEFLSIIVYHIVLNLKRSKKRMSRFTSLDNDADPQQNDPKLVTPSPADEVEQKLLWQQILGSIPDKYAREAFRRRYALRESAEEIAETMREAIPGITRERVHQLVGNALYALRNNPSISQFMNDLR